MWFAGNSVMADLVKQFALPSTALSHLTSVVQLGFISGTLFFAILSIPDRFKPSQVFFASALVGALFNALTLLDNNTFFTLLLFRFLTGFFLAGIYPVGMKIAADYYDKSLGKSLGFLVGALVLGTAFPHAVIGFFEILPWKTVLLTTSGLAFLGGISMLLFVPEGPLRKQGGKLQLSAIKLILKDKQFRSAAIAYFGHMWELYAFWTFVPSIILYYFDMHKLNYANNSIPSFLIIGIGSLACVISGIIAAKMGSKRIAYLALFGSMLCCLLSPLAILQPWYGLFLGFMFIWGILVIADSPLLSTLVAQNAPPEFKGSALTLVNCLGFSITIVSIQLCSLLFQNWNAYTFMILAIGPLLGLFALKSKKL